VPARRYGGVGRASGQDVRMTLDRQGASESTGERVDPAPGRGGGRRRIHPVFRDLGITVLAQAAVAFGGLLLYRLIALELGTAAFAEFSLVKQGAAIVFPVVTVGLVGGLPRYLALPGRPDGPTPEAYLGAAIAISGAATLAACGVALSVPGPTAELFFGSSDRSDLVPAFAGLVAATSIFYVAYGWFRGLLRLRSGGALQVLGLAVSQPLVVLLFPNEDVSTLILVMALALAVLSVLFVLRPVTRVLAERHRQGASSARRALWAYGHRRVPGELAQLALFALVPLVAAHAATLQDVAYLTAGQQVLSLFSLAVVPLGLVLLPTLTRLWAEDRERASGYVGNVASLSVHVALLLGIQALVYADVAVRAWLGEGFDDAGTVVRIVVTPGALFVIYLMLRSTLDAVEVRSFNSRNNLLALLLFGVTLGALLGLDLTQPALSVAWAFALGLTAQGVLTFITVHRLFGLAGTGYDLRLALPLAVLAGLAGVGARPLVDGSAAPLPLLALLELVLAAAYFGLLWRARVGWARLVRERFLSAPRG
jgi:O-antigen/teichoic acid export membrane protein